MKRRSRLPRLLFAAAALLAVFFAGMYVEAVKVFPADSVRSAYKTLAFHLKHLVFPAWDAPDRAVAQAGRGSVECAPWPARTRMRLATEFGVWMLRCPTAHMARADAASARLEFLAGAQLADPVLVKGEVGAFLDHCPGPWGCLAVEYSRSGSVRHAWPFRPEEIAAANISPVADYPYEHPLGWTFVRNVKMYHISPYPNGDVLAVFHSANSHPEGTGVARIAPDGRPRWYRKDYSHHWPHVVDDDLALVPSLHMSRRRLSHEIPVGGRRRKLTFECSEAIFEDKVNVLDRHGALVEEIPILDAIAGSRHAASLLFGANDCDPTHLNFAHVLGADAGGASGIAPGDMVVSLRGLNAFGILDKDDRRLKKLVRGTFQGQHGVRHLDRARFVMFDNLGADGAYGPSRLLIVDLATGEETTVFPNDATPEQLRDWFTSHWGQFDVSPDRRRALLADVQGGRAFEVRLADGKVLNVFHQLHDLSDLAGISAELTKNAWVFRFHGIHYANRRVP